MSGKVFEMEMKGLKELQAQLLELAGAAGGQKELVRIARKAMKPVLADAKMMVPKDTGLLGDSLIIVTTKPKSGSIVASAGLKVRVANEYRETRRALKKTGIKKFSRLKLYTKRRIWRKSAHWRWHFVELGTSKQPARPFLRPAFMQNRQQIASSVIRDLQNTIKRISFKKKKAKKR